MIAGYGHPTISAIDEYFLRVPVGVDGPAGFSGYGAQFITKREVDFQVKPGDQTVPLVSASAVPCTGLYYKIGTHNGMLKDTAVQQQVLGLLQQGAGIYNNRILDFTPTGASRYLMLALRSPAVMIVSDSGGRQCGYTPEGIPVEDVPNSSCLTFGDEHFVLVPGADPYHVEITGTGNGTMTVEQIEVRDDGRLGRRMKWFSVPIRMGGHGSLDTSIDASSPVLIVDSDGDGVINYRCGPDADGDRVPDAQDQYPNTPLGAVVNAQGGCISQIVPPTGPNGNGWSNHGQYVAAVANVAGQFLSRGLITASQKDAVVSVAAQSSIGQK
jgi:hypothetical protein